MSLEDASRIRVALVTWRGSADAVAIHDALWLRAALLDQCQRLPVDERARFETRADRILARLCDRTTLVSPSDTPITVVRNGKR